jgi:hypothetical protein
MQIQPGAEPARTIPARQPRQRRLVRLTHVKPFVGNTPYPVLIKPGTIEFVRPRTDGHRGSIVFLRGDGQLTVAETIGVVERRVREALA